MMNDWDVWFVLIVVLVILLSVCMYALGYMHGVRSKRKRYEEEV